MKLLVVACTYLLIAIPFGKCCFANTVERSEKNVDSLNTSGNNVANTDDPTNGLAEGSAYANGHPTDKGS